MKKFWQKKKAYYNIKFSHITYYLQTNTQLLNSINLKLNKYPNVISDLFINNNNARVDGELIHQVQLNNIFNNIYLFEKRSTSQNTLPPFINQIHNFYLNLLNLIIELKYINNIINHSEPYTHLVLPGLWANFLDIAICFIKKNPSIKIILVEDGLGSYRDTNDLAFQASLLSKIIWRILHHSNRKKDITTLLCKVEETNVYRPNMVYSQTSIPINKLNPLTLENPVYPVLSNTIRSLSFYMQYLNRNVYYILQGWLKEDAGFSICSNTIRDICTVFNPKDIIIKGHPNSRYKIQYHTFPIEIFPKSIYYDTQNFFFEALIPHLKIEDKVLITIYSSLVMYPKLLFDKEPFVVFTYKLYPGIYSLYGDALNHFSITFKSNYHNPEKVFIPSNMDEFHSNLNEIKRMSDTLLNKP